MYGGAAPPPPTPPAAEVVLTPVPIKEEALLADPTVTVKATPLPIVAALIAL